MRTGERLLFQTMMRTNCEPDPAPLEFSHLGRTVLCIKVTLLFKARYVLLQPHPHPWAHKESAWREKGGEEEEENALSTLSTNSKDVSRTSQEHQLQFWA